ADRGHTVSLHDALPICAQRFAYTFSRDVADIGRHQFRRVEFSLIAECNEVLYHLNIAFDLQLTAANKRRHLLTVTQFWQYAHVRNHRAVSLAFPLTQNVKLAFAEDQHKRRRELL